MANYVEFIGAPGVGKTSTYLTLRSNKNEDRWILYEKLFGNGRSRQCGPKKRLEILFHCFLNPGALPQVQSDPFLLQRFVEQNKDLVDFFWVNQTKRNHSYKKDLRFYSANYISGIFEKIQNIKESSSTKLCLLDEGLIHNINNFMRETREKNAYDEMLEILELIQLPAAVIYFDGEVETIVERTFDRGNLRPKDSELSPEEIVESRRYLLEMKKISIRAIETRKIPVLVVQAQDSLQKKSAQIRSFIHSLVYS